MLRYDAGDVRWIECDEPMVCEVSLDVYTEYVSRSSSLAVDIILVAISPLTFVRLIFG